MAEYFAGGHLRFVQGEWRDDNGNPVEIERVRRGRWVEAKEPLGWNDVTVASCSVCGDSWVLDEFTIEEFAKWHQYCSSCGAKMDGYITMTDTEDEDDE